MKIIVIGAGAWGTALAVAAARAHDVTLRARRAEQAHALQTERQNTVYLPGVPLPPNLLVDCAGVANPQADLVLVATPMKALRLTLAQLRDCRAAVAWLCKGFEEDTGLLGHEVRSVVAPDLAVGALSGPSFALEVARGQPTALVAASAQASVRDALVAAFHSPALRVYANDDIAGVEVGGAVKNVMAIATGLCDGLQLGLNARAALVT
ncbi:MAG: hypothetical protein RLZZ126_2103, partial [Pseudomonadota bacterium]